MTDSKKLNLIMSELVTIKSGMKKMDVKIDEGLTKINLIIENEIKPGIRILAENYVPAVKNMKLKLKI